MVAEPKIVVVTADTALADVLDDAADAPVRLERNGIIYRLSRETEPEEFCGFEGLDGEGMGRASTAAVAFWRAARRQPAGSG